MARYVFRQAYERELQRLQLLERYTDDVSRRALLSLAPLEGSYCADIGAGAGSVVHWLSEQVGDHGAVEAIDVDPRHLAGTMPENVSVIRADIDEVGISERYDLIHCRFLLLHLPDARRTLEALMRALKPRGTLVVIDSDHSTWVIEPKHAAAQRVRSAYLAVAEGAGWNLAFGGDLPPMLETAGFANVSGEGFVEYVRGGSSACQFLAASFMSLENELLDTGLTSKADLESTVLSLLGDPSFAMRYVTIWSVKGSRPLGLGAGPAQCGD